MNLVAKEYIACKRDETGVLILSEFAGAAQELFNALIVNPYDVKEIAAGIRSALTLPDDEKRHRLAEMRDRVLRCDARYWAHSFIQDLHRWAPHTTTVAELADEESNILQHVRKARHIACFLDYDGTLRDFEGSPADAAPTDEIRALLDRLHTSRAIDTFIISGRIRDDLIRWLGHYHLTLIAEHGYTYRLAGETDWRLLRENLDLSWRVPIREILTHYAATTPGSSVEEKHCSVVWHYRRSDPEFGRWKAHQLLGDLLELLSNLPVEVHHGNRIVEVSSMEVNKGAALEALSSTRPYDLIFCVGDDQTDEAMFRVARHNLLSVKVGPGETRARFHVAAPEDMRRLLHKMLDIVPQPQAQPHE